MRRLRRKQISSSTSQNDSVERNILKWQAFVMRGGPVYANCDRCGKHLGYENEMHELIQRRWTQGNDEARALSYLPTLTALLCPACHRHFHDQEPSDKERTALWQRLFQLVGIYLGDGTLEDGRRLVAADFQRVQDAMRTRLPIELPEVGS